MRGIEEIQAENDEHYRKAKKAKAKPFIAKTDGDEGVFKCPFLGVYLPKGWEFVQKHWVDHSGFGSESEPALTPKQFLAKVKKGHGYSLREAGQFQVWVNEFKRAVTT